MTVFSGCDFAREQGGISSLLEQHMLLIKRCVNGAKGRYGSLDREDLMQEAMLGLVSAAETYDKGKTVPFEAYATVCIKNRFRTLVSVSKRRKNAPFENWISLNDSTEQNLPALVSRESPEELCISRERFQILLSQINTVLSDFERSTLLFYLYGCTYEELALKLKVDSKQIDNALQRVRRKFRQLMSEED